VARRQAHQGGARCHHRLLLPVRLSAYLGAFISLVAFVGATVVLFNKLERGIGEWGWPSLMVTMLFLGGVQMLILGIVGEYRWRISNEVRGRPQYIVMEQCGLEDRGAGARSEVAGAVEVARRL
jgi:hypothetical protein